MIVSHCLVFCLFKILWNLRQRSFWIQILCLKMVPLLLPLRTFLKMVKYLLMDCAKVDPIGVQFTLNKWQLVLILGLIFKKSFSAMKTLFHDLQEKISQRYWRR